VTDIVPASTIPDDMLEGLADFAPSDMTLPTIKIVHKEGVFKDSLSGEEFDTLKCVVLGLVKQRILWDPDVQEDAKPLCKSLNFAEGRPGEGFPWKKTGFQSTGTDDQVLSCEACPLKEWNTHPSRKDVPWCTQQHTYIIAMPFEDGFTPAMITFQGAGIKPSNSYLSSFARTKSPTFTAFTKITLERLKRGTVEYAVPVFSRQEPTDEADFPDFIQQYRSIRTFLHTPRKREEEAEEGVPAPSPAAAAAPQQQRSVDEMPF
jgi:hypothetical protein